MAVMLPRHVFPEYSIAIESFTDTGTKTDSIFTYWTSADSLLTSLTAIALRLSRRACGVSPSSSLTDTVALFVRHPLLGSDALLSGSMLRAVAMMYSDSVWYSRVTTLGVDLQSFSHDGPDSNVESSSFLNVHETGLSVGST